MKGWSWAIVAVATSVLLVGGGFYARYRASKRTARAAAEISAVVASGGVVVLRVSRATNAITLDGDTDDPGWLHPPAARTGDFLLADGKQAQPYTEVRAVWGDGYLYLDLYASDNDIETRTDQADGPLWLDDSFRIVFSRGGVEYSIEASPKAVITDAIRRDGGDWDYSWNSGVHASKEMDGTLNDPTNMDEEWAVEMAIPLESLGLKGERGEIIGMTVTRCDTPKHEARICVGWGAGWGHRTGLVVLE